MSSARDLSAFASIDPVAAAARVAGAVSRTPLLEVEVGDPRVQLRAKLENRQVTGAFKARGAWNNVALLTEDERARGVVACSSGNHGKALAWAAREAGVAATIVMPQDAYPNKIAACRELGAEVVLSVDRKDADRVAAEYEAQGRVFVHPYDRAGTVEGAGTVGVELLEDWPEVEVVLVPVGGGGLIAGTSLHLRRERGDGVVILGAEPAGAPSMHRGLAAGAPVALEAITTTVQGLCPTSSGALNVAVCRETLDGVVLVDDEAIHAAQGQLVRLGETVEPAGGAALAVVREGLLPAHLLEHRGPDDPLRVCCVISGGNPDPAQLAALREGA